MRGHAPTVAKRIVERAAAVTGKKMEYEYVEQNRAGDHICYISDLSKMRAHYPGWGITKTLDCLFEEIYMAQRNQTNN